MYRRSFRERHSDLRFCWVEVAQQQGGKVCNSSNDKILLNCIDLQLPWLNQSYKICLQYNSNYLHLPCNASTELIYASTELMKKKFPINVNYTLGSTFGLSM